MTPGAGRGFLPRAAYGTIFVAALPAALVAWARGASGQVHLPALHSPVFGASLIAFGIGLALTGMATLWFRGGGLPMNAFPPPRFVLSGIYSFVPHPIYGGFTIVCAGAALWSGSASGLWLVTPSVAMGCAALVLGYELPSLRSRFGAPEFSLWLPQATPDEPSLMERLRIYPVIVLPWIVCFELIGLMGKPPDAMSTYLPFEFRLPVIEATEPIYASTYLAVLAAPMLARSGLALRRFAQRGLIAMALIFPFYLLLPFYVPPRPFHAVTPLGEMLSWERTPISGTGAMPSFHIVWAMIAASALGEGRRSRRILWWAWAALVAVSCVTTGMHSIADVLAGMAAFAVVVRMPALWKAMLRGAEYTAASWQEWHVGPVRIIDHGAYAGMAAAAGILIIDSMLGRGGEWLSLSICCCSLVGAALWAQSVEGSPALLRPMGFYGGVLGALAGALPAPLLHIDVWVAIAAVCMAAPWIQAIGRLRCLVQGCCHGRPAETAPGIRYTHPQSRVCRLTPFGGVPVHATPVYSIVWNIATGAALIRLEALHTSSAMICGIYLLLSGFGRFAEEAYRGEPQTRIVFGLRFYQWIAVATVIAGAAVTCIAGTPSLRASRLTGTSLLVAAVCAILAWFMTGVDFPASSRRFARLT